MRRCTMKGLLIMFSVAVLFSLGFTQQTLQMGIVNSQNVLENSAEGKKVMTQLEQKDKKNQDELAKMDEEIRQKETKLNTQRLTLTQEAMMNLNSDLDRLRTQRKRFAEDSLREMNELTGRLFQKIQGELLPIIEQIGKEKNLDIILDLARSGAIYFNPTIDLTDEVIKRYDASKAAKK